MHGLVTGDIPDGKWHEFLRASAIAEGKGFARLPPTADMGPRAGKSGEDDMDADTIPLAISVSGASKRKRGVTARAVCGGVVPSEQARGGVQGSARDVACPAAKRQSPVADATVHGSVSERAAGAAELPRVGASADEVWSGAPRGVELGALHERPSQLPEANSVSAAAAQFGRGEEMDAAGCDMGVCVCQSGHRAIR